MDQCREPNHIRPEGWTFDALEKHLWGGYDRLSDSYCFLEGCDSKFPTLCGKQRQCPKIAHWENSSRIFGYYY